MQIPDLSKGPPSCEGRKDCQYKDSARAMADKMAFIFDGGRILCGECLAYLTEKESEARRKAVDEVFEQ